MQFIASQSATHENANFPAGAASAVRSKIAVISAALPPLLDGIGDYSSRLARMLAEHSDVRIFSVLNFEPEPIDGIEIVQAFTASERRSFMNLVEAVSIDPPDWLIFQYNPFCYGSRGINPYLGRALKKLKRRCANLRLAVMIHEMFMPANSPANTVMSVVQRWQLAALTSIADVSLFSTGPWFDAFHARHPNRNALHMPVGSNLDPVPADRADVRMELELPENAIVLGTFGNHHPSRLLTRLARSAYELRSSGFDVRILSIGPAGPAVRSALPGLPVIDLGSLPARQVSRFLNAIDIYCCPFVDGVSTRRGSFFAGLQHGLPIVTTDGYHTDADLRSLQGNAVMMVPAEHPTAFTDAVIRLARHPEMRMEVGRRAAEAFEANYSSPVLAQRWRQALEPTAAPPVSQSRKEPAWQFPRC